MQGCMALQELSVVLLDIGPKMAPCLAYAARAVSSLCVSKVRQYLRCVLELAGKHLGLTPARADCEQAVSRARPRLLRDNR